MKCILPVIEILIAATVYKPAAQCTVNGVLLQKLKDTGAKTKIVFPLRQSITSLKPVLFTCDYVFRLQELEDQYRKEREEANNLLEQQRLVQ